MTYYRVRKEYDNFPKNPKTRDCEILTRTLAFSDCSDEEVILIIYEGKEIHYVGWQPDMIYKFADEAGNIIWSNSFPQWDH